MEISYFVKQVSLECVQLYLAKSKEQNISLFCSRGGSFEMYNNHAYIPVDAQTCVYIR